MGYNCIKGLSVGGEVNEGLIEITAVYKFSLFNKFPFNKIPMLNKLYTYRKQFKAIKEKNKDIYWMAL